MKKSKTAKAAVATKAKKIVQRSKQRTQMTPVKARALPKVTTEVQKAIRFLPNLTPGVTTSIGTAFARIENLEESSTALEHEFQELAHAIADSSEVTSPADWADIAGARIHVPTVAMSLLVGASTSFASTAVTTSTTLTLAGVLSPQAATEYRTFNLAEVVNVAASNTFPSAGTFISTSSGVTSSAVVAAGATASASGVLLPERKLVPRISLQAMLTGVLGAWGTTFANSPGTKALLVGLLGPQAGVLLAGQGLGPLSAVTAA